MFKNKVGNLWNETAEVKVITTNGIVKELAGNYTAVMGKGVALQAAIRWPSLPLRLGRNIHAFGNVVHALSLYSVPESAHKINAQWLVSLPVKNHWRDDADPELIDKSLQELVYLTDRHGWTDILLPEPGTGAGNLSWEAVKPMLEYYLDDRFTVIHLE